MVEEIKWQTLNTELQKITRIVEENNEIIRWKIEYEQIILILAYDEIPSTLLTKLGKHFPKYTIDTNPSIRIIIPLNTTNNRRPTIK